jgi:hypothetical protein
LEGDYVHCKYGIPFFSTLHSHGNFSFQTKWFKQWKKYVGYESWDAFSVGQSEAYPGPVDNSPLIDGNDN